MTRLPQVTGARVKRALEQAGFVLVRQEGSHAIMRHPADTRRWATVPIHGGRSVKPGTLRSILAGAGLTVEEFTELL